MIWSKIFYFFKKILPITIGIVLLWWVYHSANTTEKEQLLHSLENAHLGFVFLSMGLGILAHFLRALRWQWALKPLGHQPSVVNLFASLMAGYLSNLGIPRSGELIRCQFVSKYEQISFSQVLGSVVMERVLDIIMLLVCCILAGICHYTLFIQLVLQFNPMVSVVVVLGMILLGIIGVLILNRLQFSFLEKLKTFGNSILEGLQSVRKVTSPFWFIVVTVCIWVLYFLMTYSVSWALPELQTRDLGIYLMAFLAGTFSMTVTSGGIGILPYPLAVASVLVFFEIENTTAEAFGWLVWTGQTLLNCILGALAFIILPLWNRRRLSMQK